MAPDVSGVDIIRLVKLGAKDQNIVNILDDDTFTLLLLTGQPAKLSTLIPPHRLRPSPIPVFSRNGTYKKILMVFGLSFGKTNNMD